MYVRLIIRRATPFSRKTLDEKGVGELARTPGELVLFSRDILVFK